MWIPAWLESVISNSSANFTEVLFHQHKKTFPKDKNFYYRVAVRSSSLHTSALWCLDKTGRKRVIKNQNLLLLYCSIKNDIFKFQLLKYNYSCRDLEIPTYLLARNALELGWCCFDSADAKLSGLYSKQPVSTHQWHICNDEQYLHSGLYAQ